MVKTIVLIHGWASTPAVWQRQKEYFSKDYEVILTDISKAENIQQAAQTVEANIKNKDDSLLIGWSLGWLVILELLKNPQLKPKALVSVSSTAKFVDDGYVGAGPTKTHLRKMLRDCRRNPKMVVEDFYQEMLSDVGKKAVSDFHFGIDYSKLISGLKMLEYCDYRERLHLINLPTLIIAGLKDRVCPKEASVFMHKKIHHSKLEILDCGHMPFLSKTDEFNRLLGVFIETLR